MTLHARILAASASHLVAAVLTIGPAAATVVAQERVLRLRPPNAQLSAEFTQIASIRELPDGRILIADRQEKRIAVADFATNSVADVGRTGRGPEEFSSVSTIYSLGGDSSLLPDVQSRRWLIMKGATIVRTVSLNAPAARAAGGTVLGADSRGFLLSRAPASLDNLRAAANSTVQLGTDSAALIRVAAASGVVDTIAKLGSGLTRMEAQLDDEGRIERISITRPVLRVDDQAHMFPDGWVAIARLQPYRVDWRSPDGRWIRGAPLPFREVRIDALEKAAYRKRQELLGRRFPSNLVEWAPTIGPFLFPHPSASLIATPEGWLLIARPPTAEQFENRYDLVDRSGNRRAQIVLPVNERIVAIGSRGAYVVVTSEFGLETVRRQPWPAQNGP